jgi:predicted HTH transcriptional regulator
MNEPGRSIANIREEAERRLEELAPLVAEAERLRSVIAVIDAEAAGGDGVRGASTPAGTSYVRADKDLILAIIAENPGITAAEIARRNGMKRTVVATTIARMKRQGKLVPDGPGARLPEG